MDFGNLIGQDRVKATLSEIVSSDRVSHAYLFNGPSGVGKKSFARVFAGSVMCPNAEKKTGDRCGVCECCVLLDNDTNPDFKVIRPEEGKSGIGVETVREMQEDMVKAPVFGIRKVYVLDGAEKMTEQAQNAFLKILEEPPSYVLMLLLCDNTLSILDTIKSRVIRVDFSRNSDAEIRAKYKMLCEQRNISPEDVKQELLCSYADGIMGRVLDFFDGDGVREKRREVMEALKALLHGDIRAKMKMTELIGGKGNYDFVLFTLISYMRDVMLTARFGRHADLQNPDYGDDIYALSRDIGYYRAKNCIDAIDRCYKKLKRNASPDVAVDYMLIELRESV